MADLPPTDDLPRCDYPDCDEDQRTLVNLAASFGDPEWRCPAHLPIQRAGSVLPVGWKHALLLKALPGGPATGSDNEKGSGFPKAPAETTAMRVAAVQLSDPTPSTPPDE